jgi:uncharacterized RmlC-like cupin family protein
MERIEVTRGSDLTKGDSTPGIARSVAFEGAGIFFGRTRIPGGNVSAWHHHGTRELFGYVVSGRLRLEWNDGKDSAEVGPGDFFHIPVGLVHRDLNPDRSATVVTNVSLGEGPTVVNLDGS